MAANLTVALVGCPSGLGHSRRVLLLGSELRSRGATVTVFLPKYAQVRLRSLVKRCGVSVRDLGCERLEDLLLNGINVDGNLNCLGEFDIVISDNLCEVLELRNDAWMSGSFFWHETGIPILPRDYQAYWRSRLAKIKPRMISSHLFSSNYLFSTVDLYEVGLYDQYPSDGNTGARDSILLSCGLGGGLAEETQSFVAKLAKTWSPPQKVKKVWIEPDLIPDDAPGWMCPADYRSTMFSSLLTTVCRPGVGTITDSLRFGCKLFLFCEPNHFEMEHNALALQKRMLGRLCSDIEDAFNRAVAYSVSPEEVLGYQELTKTLNFNGASEAAEVILGSAF